MKLTTGILAIAMMTAGAAYGQNPDVIDNTRSTMKSLQQKQANDSDAALNAAGVPAQSAKPAPGAPAPKTPAAPIVAKAQAKQATAPATTKTPAPAAKAAAAPATAKTAAPAKTSAPATKPAAAPAQAKTAAPAKAPAAAAAKSAAPATKPAAPAAQTKTAASTAKAKNPMKPAAKAAAAKSAAKPVAKEQPKATPAAKPAADAKASTAAKPADALKPAPKPEEKKWAMNGKRDPFFSPVVQQPTGSGCSTGKKCLEIGAINLRGVVKSESGFIAVVTNNLNKAYFLRENDPVFNGYVVRITGDSVVFQETVQDKLGKPFTREVVKRIFTPAV